MAKKKQQLSRRQFFGGATAVGGRAALSGAFTGSAAAATAAKMPFSSQMPQSWGGDPSAPFDEGALIWDLKDDPVHPKLLGHFHTGGSGAPQRLRGRSLRALSYGAAGLIALDISDVSNPQLVGRLDFAPPFVPNIAVHSVLPLPERGIAVVNSEAIASRGNEPLNHASTVDISNPSRLRLLSVFPLPEPPPNAPFASFYDRGGRFGPHNTNLLYHRPFTNHSADLVYLAHFNARLPIFDIKDARGPEEVGYFLPPDPTQRLGPPASRCAGPAGARTSWSTPAATSSSPTRTRGCGVLRYTGPS